MAPKPRKGASAPKPKAGDEEREEPLQALVLTDPFETRFSPLTLEQPRCLLPLANTPLIEYTLEFLANAGVDEVFLFCGAHTALVERYIEHSKWSSLSSPFSKLEIVRSTSNSIGDAMREMDRREDLNGDFVLVYGDVVSNFPLESALAAHRARRSVDRNAIMTMVLREAGTHHRTKAQGTRPIFVIDNKGRCLHFEQMPNRENKSFLSIDPLLLSDNQELEVRQDLIDCGIDICTPDVLALWSDNFDFQAPRKGFLHSVLKDYDLNGKIVYTHVVTDHYAARVRNLRAYDSVSKDIVSRWAYPLCPDSNLLQHQSYRLQKGNIYMEEGVNLARSCLIHRRTVIGRGTSVGEGTVISNSVIGRGCIIGKNVTIDGAYVWDNAVIQDGSIVQKAIIADEAVVGRKCHIEEGALISYRVRISDGVKVLGTSRVTRAKRKREEGEDLETGKPNPTVVGEKGDGFEYDDAEEMEEEEFLEGLSSSKLIYNLENLALSKESISTLNSDSEFDDDHGIYHDRSGAGSFVSVSSAGSDTHAANFDHDAASSLYDSLVDGHDSSNMQLELTSLRMSTNASEHQVRRAVAVAFMKRISQLVNGGTAVKEAVDQVFAKHKHLLERTIFDRSKASKVDQVDFLLLVQQDLVHRERGDEVLLHVATHLYRIEVIESEGLEQWWEDSRSTENEELGNVRIKTRALIDFLAESSEEEDDDEDEEEEEEEDDE